MLSITITEPSRTLNATILFVHKEVNPPNMTRYIGYSRFDIANGPGIRVSIFLSGCSFKCKGCWSATAQNPRMGEPFTADTIRMVLDDCAQTGIAGLSILGGEPFENTNATKELVQAFRAKFGNS